MAVGSFERMLERVPGGHYVRVFVGFCLVMGVGACGPTDAARPPPSTIPIAVAGMAPVAWKKTRAGHDYFSSEKPEAVERGTVHGV